MPDVRYRLYLDDRAATREQLDCVEDVTVDQEIDMAWEARLVIPVCTDDKGRWSGESESFLKSFSRVRVELKVGDGSFVALIDGPVVGSEHALSAQPGRSTVTVRVHDDSVFLNRRDEVVVFENLLDHEIASRIFSGVRQIARTDVEQTRGGSTGLSPVEVQRGTAMQLLRRLAVRNAMHAYVLPGTRPGQSVGTFKRLPTRADGLPALVLLGSERNVAAFTVGNDAQRPATVVAHTLGITDKATSKGTAKLGDVDRLGANAPVESREVGTRLLPPGQDVAADPRERATAEATRRSFAFDANGSVTADCYGAVLTPYRVVTVRGVNGRLSGDYVLKRVSHRLTRADYTQSFGLLRNAVSQGTGSGQQASVGSPF